MAVKAFKFASPGIFLNEIDQSQIQQPPAPVGPIIIGRAQRGPAMRPVTVASYNEFVAAFGDPVPGPSADNDAWRTGIPAGPTYAAYAAQAWLANNPTVTFVRLLGTQTSNATSTTAVNNGYAGWTVGSPSSTSTGGAYGLFVFPSQSADVNAKLTGSLAAVWYTTSTVPVLSGTQYLAGGAKQANGLMITSDSNGVFTVQMSGTAGVDKSLKKSFNFNPTDEKFIRKVFNTNPQNTNTDTSTGVDQNGTSYFGYWLGETFENDLAYNVVSGSTYPLNGTSGVATSSVGIILPLNNFGNGRLLQGGAKEENAARTGWIIAQGTNGTDPNFNPASTATKMFRLVSLGYGDWTRNNIKITINNIKAPQNAAQSYGTFDVEVRAIYDTDANKKILESFTGCDLNPSSPNFVARRIGNTKYSWDDVERRLTEIGDYPNNSQYIRVDMYSDYNPVSNPANIPFGVLGPLKYSDAAANPTNSVGFIAATSSCFAATSSANFTASAAGYNQAFSFVFPSLRTRASSTEDSLTTYKLADWGASTTRTPSTTLYNDGVNDLLRLPVTGTGFTTGQSGGGLAYAWAFSLDDIQVTGTLLTGSTWQNKYFIYTPGSKASGTSYTAVGSGSGGGTYADLVNVDSINSFTTTLQGGTDGFNIVEGEPLRNTALDSNKTDQNSYIYYTYRRAIDTVGDPEAIQGNILSIPGLTHEPLTLYATQVAEKRGDVLAVIDIAGGSSTSPSYISKYEVSDNVQQTTDRTATPDQVIARMKARNLNTSYGATYYPWVQIADSTTGQILVVPPSIPAIGAMSYTDKVQAPWFAPAGFNRGGLSTGNAGVNVVNIVKKLNQTDRDKLYPLNVNPIASFPNEGIVIFGQKTLQATPSALDRINVRRLMLYIKKGINQISTTILFEPNVEDTWNNFKDKAEPFLADVKARFGLTDYKLILDSTTTTPDLIDQNIMYAKIYLKPARAIEFIAVDFFITKTGATFPA
jgi:hypothetical protein